MNTLAQRVRDFRYSKGWGPDELASRAEISRTALYQIESGKTGLPRAGTLRRIAVALDVTMDDLLGNPEPAAGGKPHPGHEPARGVARGREYQDWIPGEGGPLTLPSTGIHSAALSHPESYDDPRTEDRFPVEAPARRAHSMAPDSLLVREGELMSKLHDLLHSPMGLGIARIVDDLHVMIAKARNSF